MASIYNSLFGTLSNPLGVSDLVGNGLSRMTGQREAFEYQKELNNTMMSREDNAYQRAVSDAQKAGLSPLSVSSGASANSMNTASIDNSGALNFSGNVLNTVLGQINENRQLDIQKKIADAQASNLYAQADATKKASDWNERNGYRDSNPMNMVASLLRQIAIKRGWIDALEGTTGSVPAGPPSSPSSESGNLPPLNKGIYDFGAAKIKVAPLAGFAMSGTFPYRWSDAEISKIEREFNHGQFINRKYLPPKLSYLYKANADGLDSAKMFLYNSIKDYIGTSSYSLSRPKFKEFNKLPVNYRGGARSWQ